MMKKLVIAALAMASPAMAAAPPCGDAPQCPTGLPKEAQSLQNAYRLPMASQSERDKIAQLIEQNTRDGRTDWKTAHDEYWAWFKEASPKPKSTVEVDGAAVLAAGKVRQRQMMEVAEAAVRNRLIDPQSAQFDWPYSFINGWWKPLLGKKKVGWVTCGYVNSRNRFGGYVGRTAFAVVVNDGAATFVDIGRQGRDFDLITLQCEKFMKRLPTAIAGPADLDEPAAPLVSVADELAKLAALRDKGVLSEAEFQAQKAKLLKR